MTFNTCPACGAKTPDLETHLSIKRDSAHAAERSSFEIEGSWIPTLRTRAGVGYVRKLPRQEDGSIDTDE
jgi:hypothetical protein